MKLISNKKSRERFEELNFKYFFTKRKITREEVKELKELMKIYSPNWKILEINI